DPDGGFVRTQRRHPAPGRRDNRDGLCHSRCRPVDKRIYFRARLSRHPRRHTGAGTAGLPGLPGDRHGAGGPRSQDRPSMSVALPITKAMMTRRGGKRRVSFVIGIVILAAFILMAFFPGLFAPYDPLAFDYQAIMQPPSKAHLFGTDNFGRDVLSRTIWATQIDMQIAIFSTLFPLVFGTFVGALTGYYGGWLDTIFGRLVDLLIAFPFLV